MLQVGTLPPATRLCWLKRNDDPIWLEIRFMRSRNTNSACEGRIIGNVRKIREAAA